MRRTAGKSRRTNSNYSDNHGKEGLGGPLDLMGAAARQHSCPAGDATALLRGTPMPLAGDANIGHSQHGNNAYRQDNAHLADWQQANRGLTTFTAALIRLVSADTGFNRQ